MNGKNKLKQKVAQLKNHDELFINEKISDEKTLLEKASKEVKEYMAPKKDAKKKTTKNKKDDL